MATAHRPASTEELIALSVELAPLRSADEAASHMFPREGTPQPVSHVTSVLQATSTRKFCTKQIRAASGSRLPPRRAGVASSIRVYLLLATPFVLHVPAHRRARARATHSLRVPRQA